VSSGSGSRLPDKKGSSAASCTMAPDPLGGLRCTMCPTAPDPASLIKRVPVPPHVPWLRTHWEGSGAPRVLRLRILQATTHRAVPCGPWATRIKKSLADLPMRQGPPVSKAHTHVSKASDVRAIISLQDVRTGSTVNACKMCGYVATIRLQSSIGPIDHSPGSATVSARSDSTAPCYGLSVTWRDDKTG
jgi:hypothetical protein